MLLRKVNSRTSENHFPMDFCLNIYNLVFLDLIPVCSWLKTCYSCIVNHALSTKVTDIRIWIIILVKQ